jgi:hypothetical protein
MLRNSRKTPALVTPPVGSFARDIVSVETVYLYQFDTDNDRCQLPSNNPTGYSCSPIYWPDNLLIPFALVSSIMLFTRIGVTGLSGLYVFEVFYGGFSASLQSLFPASLTSLTMDLERLLFELEWY